MMNLYFFKCHYIKVITFKPGNIFELTWYSEWLLVVYCAFAGKRELNIGQNTGLNFGTVFYGKNHCAHSEKRDKKPDITRPTFIHEGIKAIEVVFVCTSRYSYRHDSSIHVTPKT